MAAGQQLFAAMALTVLLLGGAGAISLAYDSGAERITVDNESFDPTGDVTLNESNRQYADYDQNVSVLNTTRNTEYAPGGNYTWFAQNGTLEVVANSELDNQSTAVIDYGLYQSDQASTGLRAMWAQLFGASGTVPIVLVAGAVLVALGRFR
jgi:hypothetical protein